MIECAIKFHIRAHYRGMKDRGYFRGGDVTENKYSPSTYLVISWEISTPPVLLSREICTPLEKKVLPSSHPEMDRK